MTSPKPDTGSELAAADIESNYLCAKCWKPLYDDQIMPNYGICLNTLCPDFPDKQLTIANYRDSVISGLKDKLRLGETELKNRILECHPQDFPEYVHRVRCELFRLWLSNQVIVRPSLWLACGELLLWMNSTQPSGAKNDHESFRAIVNQIRDWRTEALKLEELENGRYRIMHTGDSPKTYRLSYLKAYHEALESAGLVSDKPQSDPDNLFPYAEIEEDVFPTLTEENFDDWSQWTRQFWSMAHQLYTVVRSSLRDTRQYGYAPDAFDQHFLFSRFLQLRQEFHNETPHVPSEKLEKELVELQYHYDKALEARGEAVGSRPAANFIRKFTDSEELVPIYTRTPKGLLMDWPTSFVFSLYVESLTSSKDEEPVPVKRTSVTEAREIVSLRFEDYLKEKLHARDYDSLGPFKLFNQGYEFDVIAWSDAKKRILLIDAKYQDIPGSIANADALAQAAVEGVVAQSLRQEKRHLQFLENKWRFEEIVADLAHPIDEYGVQSYLVTKHIPVVWRVRGVKIFRALEFLTSQA